MSAKAVTCCIRIFEVLEGTDILNADILDMLASTLMDDFASTSFASSFMALSKAPVSRFLHLQKITQ